MGRMGQMGQMYLRVSPSSQEPLRFFFSSSAPDALFCGL